MLNAIWIDCPGMRNGKREHFLLDNCWSCAPFWERIPLCPTCHKKLMKQGKTKCKSCGKFILVSPDVEEEERMRQFREQHERLRAIERETR